MFADALERWLLFQPISGRSRMRARGGEHVRTETWVTQRTGHMGNTFRFRAGGVDAVEREFGRGRTPAFRGPCFGRGALDRALPGVRDFPVSQSTRTVQRWSADGQL